MLLGEHREPEGPPGRAIARVVICSPVRLFSDGLAQALARDAEIVVAATERDLDRCLATLRESTAQIALVDVSDGDGAAAVAALRAGAPDAPIVAIGPSEDADEILALAEAGVGAYITREQSLDDLRAAVSGLVRGEALCAPRLTALLLGRLSALAGERDRTKALALTPRESEILELIAQGKSNKQIALALTIELATVKNHVHHILDKLDVDRRGEAVDLLRTGRIQSPA